MGVAKLLIQEIDVEKVYELIFEMKCILIICS